MAENIGDIKHKWEYFQSLGPFLTRSPEDGFITSAEREVKDSRREGMYQSYNFSPRLGV